MCCGTLGPAATICPAFGGAFCGGGLSYISLGPGGGGPYE